MSRRALGGVVLLAIAAGCGGPGIGGPFVRDVRREAKPQPETEIKSADGFFSARVPARLSKAVATTPQAYYALLDFGAKTPAECFVYQREIDLASALVASARSAAEDAGKHIGREESRELADVQSGAAGGVPYLALTWVYRLDRGEEEDKAAGEIDQLGGSKSGYSFLCVHSDVGYHESFRRVAEAFAASLAFGWPSPEPYYQEAVSVSLGDRVVGLGRLTFTRDVDGSTRVVQTSSSLMPVDERTVVATDTTALQWSHPDGRLVKETYAEMENGELVTKLDLALSVPGRWRVTGEYQSKKLQQEIATETAPVSLLGDYLRARRAIEQKGVGAAVTLRKWAPEVDPSRFLDESIEITARRRDGAFDGVSRLGPIEQRAVVDANGAPLSGSARIGRVEISFERLHASGAY